MTHKELTMQDPILLDPITLSVSELLEHPDPAVRLELVHGLGLEASPASLPVLARALKDEDPLVRLAAGWALARILAAESASPVPA